MTTKPEIDTFKEYFLTSDGKNKPGRSAARYEAAMDTMKTLSLSFIDTWNNSTDTILICLDNVSIASIHGFKNLAGTLQDRSRVPNSAGDYEKTLEDRILLNLMHSNRQEHAKAQLLSDTLRQRAQLFSETLRQRALLARVHNC